jgi:zinc protease
VKRFPHLSNTNRFELSSGVEEHKLANGLKVLLKSVPDSNSVSTWIFYRVGSRNERPGITGSSHWCEHMMFKGGGKLGKGEVHKLVSEEGGRNNAFTDQDLTAYYETLPKEKKELALFIESERMANAAFDPKEVASERQVVISEREGSENYPSYLLREEMFATAFRIHSYRWPVVGWKSDLRRITRDDLYDHYKSYYHPGNATLVVCGAFSADEELQSIKKYFGGIEGDGEKEKPVVDTEANSSSFNLPFQEPEQSGERTSALCKPGTLDYLAAGYRLPPITHDDTPALIVLTTILGGWRGLIGFSSDRFTPRSNRLYRKLVEGKIVSEVDTYFPVNLDPGLLYIALTILPGISISGAREKLLSAIATTIDSAPSEDEMRVAFNQIRSWHAYENDGAALQAQSIGLMDLMESYSLADELVSRSLKVSSDEVSRVAKAYLSDRNRTICTYESKT